MNRHLLAKNLNVFSQNSKMFLQILMIILKNRCHSKIILGVAVFQLLSESTYSLKLSFLLNNSIRSHWLPFDLIVTWGKIIKIIKFNKIWIRT